MIDPRYISVSDCLWRKAAVGARSLVTKRSYFPIELGTALIGFKRSGIFVIQVLRSDLEVWTAKQVYWLSEAEWKRIEPLLPRGRKAAHRVDDRRMISGIMHMLRSGARCRDCPDIYGPYTTERHPCRLHRNMTLRRQESDREPILGTN